MGWLHQTMSGWRSQAQASLCNEAKMATVDETPSMTGSTINGRARRRATAVETVAPTPPATALERPVGPPASAAHTSLARTLRLPEVIKMTGLGRSLIYRLQSQQRFPHSVRLADSAVGWLEAEVQAWVAARVAESRQRSTTLRPPAARAPVKDVGDACG